MSEITSEIGLLLKVVEHNALIQDSYFAYSQRAGGYPHCEIHWRAVARVTARQAD